MLARTGLKVQDMDVIEANEAFAAQACAVVQELGLQPSKVNPNGSGISLATPWVLPAPSSPPRRLPSCTARAGAMRW